jgi:hypothetical protein
MSLQCFFAKRLLTSDPFPHACNPYCGFEWEPTISSLGGQGYPLMRILCAHPRINFERGAALGADAIMHTSSQAVAALGAKESSLSFQGKAFTARANNRRSREVDRCENRDSGEKDNCRENHGFRFYSNNTPNTRSSSG